MSDVKVRFKNDTSPHYLSVWVRGWVTGFIEIPWGGFADEDERLLAGREFLERCLRRFTRCDETLLRDCARAAVSFLDSSRPDADVERDLMDSVRHLLPRDLAR